MGSLPLKPAELPLTGRHLIEASAGTGKTYNITRIYLRLLLEKKLEVQSILVMTFTRAATEELRGRIAQELRSALDNWETLIASDPFFQALGQKISESEASPLLKRALLHLDEAAIFTIHGFCKRVLSQQAFASGLAFNMQLEADTTEVELEAVRDWYRQLAVQPDQYRYLVLRWSTPDLFRSAFGRVIRSDVPLSCSRPQDLEVNYLSQKESCLAQLRNDEAEIFSALIDSHKDKAKRTEEWTLLLQWLAQADLSPLPKQAAATFNATRFGREPEKKARLLELFDQTRSLNGAAKEIEGKINRARSYELAQAGIGVIRQRIRQAKLTTRLMNFDDLVQQLEESLSAPDGDLLADILRNQFPVALVDEFQDTDPLQYRILEAIYPAHGVSALYMIGDPKQAIYAFRGGDVFAYLQAREDADQQWMMTTNWRSSPAMIAAYNRLFYGAPLDQAGVDIFSFGIEYSPVDPAPTVDENAFVDPGGFTALQLIDFPFNEDYQAGRNKSQVVKKEFCEVIASWCSEEVDRLLSSGVTFEGQSLQEQDIAILVRDRGEAQYLQNALTEAGYPSVYLSTRDNLFHSEEAKALYQALLGILELENDRLLIAALATRYFAGDTAMLYQLQEDEGLWDQQREWFTQLRAQWYKRGFMAMALSMVHHAYQPHPEHHERALTNTIHLLELLQQASQQQQQPRQLLEWLAEQIDTEGSSAEAELRLESDANLIRIITQHGSKGLEYPVVFVPFATRYKDPVKFGPKTLELIDYHDRQTFEQHYHLGQDPAILNLCKEEGHAETVRLLYVAITRAKQRCYLCSAPFAGYESSPLGQILKLDSSDDLPRRLQVLADELPGAIGYQQVTETTFNISRTSSLFDEDEPAAVSEFHGRIERNWWLSSFSALTRNLRHGGLSTPDHDQNSVEEDLSQTPATTDIRFTLRKGADAGNLLHDTLERTDFTAPLWLRSLEKPLARFGTLPENCKVKDLTRWLDQCLKTALPSGAQLSDLSWGDTLRESEFYFPMQQVKLSGLGKLLAVHRQQAVQLDLPGNRRLQGMMHGFIDLIYHWQGRYYVVDYKSTHLGDRLNHYDHQALEKNMRDNYYDLQYLIYSLALHRYLRSRMSDYDPAVHFGGVHYLYLRGMAPGKTSGIYTADLSVKRLGELDELFGEARYV